jgi:queuine/archaeosine tRNA-ribosyltransferase
MIASNGTTHQGSWVLNQATNEGQVCNDIHVVSDYVNKLLKKSVVVWHKLALANNVVFHKHYMKNCRALIADGHLMVISNEEAEGYMAGT